LSSRIGIDAIDASVFRRNENHVMGCPCEAQIGEVKRLGVHFAIHSDDKQKAKIGRAHIAGRKSRLVKILPGPTIIVVISGHSARG
jgi:hypothetical protein